MRRNLFNLMILVSLALCGIASFARADDAASQLSHEFRYKPDAGSSVKTVNLGGDFNVWSTTATPMEKLDDGTFVAIVKLTAGKHFYKLVVDGNTWINDPAADKSLEEDDGQQGKNSAVIIGAGEKPAASGMEHTFSYKPADGDAPKSVNIAGEFNKWSTTAQPMTRGDDGIFTAKVKLPPGTYQYKLVIDGTKWVNDPTADKSLDQPDGNGGANSVVVFK